MSQTENIPLKEYPRPQLVRSSYTSLNGYWDYAFRKNEEFGVFQGKILVPFSPESSYSGVMKTLKPDEVLHYHRKVTMKKEMDKEYLLIHFEACDQEATVYVNQVKVFNHLGGYTPFTIELELNSLDSAFDLDVFVRDITDLTDRQTGKQRMKRGGIFYTPQSGLWLPVWMEQVSKNYVISYQVFPDIDHQKAKFQINSNHQAHEETKIEVFFHEEKLIDFQSSENYFELDLPSLHLWSPEEPNLYQFQMTYGSDTFSGYFGMKKIERRRHPDGNAYFYLNNHPYFVNGVLDQGYFHQTHLTPPSFESYEKDILTMKQCGYNMLRKHIKIENLRYYYYADLYGMLVWQDMVSGTTRKDIVFHGLLAQIGIHLNDRHHKIFGRPHLEHRVQFIKEMEEMVNHLRMVTSIVTYVPFNEAWGQFDSRYVTEKLKQMDSSKLIDHASGWSDQKISDYYSRHIYFTKIRFFKHQARNRIRALTEYGGYSMKVKDHTFDENVIFGYKKFKTKEELMKAIKDLYFKQLIPQVRKGLNCLVYTQLSDVEDEENGLITYDRQIIKIDIDLLKQYNESLKKAFQEKVKYDQ